MSEKILEWGSFVLVPFPMKLGEVSIRQGASDTPLLEGRDFATDIAVVKVTSETDIPEAIRRSLLMPTILPFGDEVLSGIWFLPDHEGQMHSSIAFWHRQNNSCPRNPADARSAFDVWVGRARVNPPVLVSYRAPDEPDAAITRWDISPVTFDGVQALHHQYAWHPEIDPVAQRDWVQADGIEWIEDGYRNVVMAWRVDLEGLVGIARGLEALSGR